MADLQMVKLSYREVQALYREQCDGSPVGKTREWLEQEIIDALRKAKAQQANGPIIQEKVDKRKLGIEVHVNGETFPSKAAAVRYLYVDQGWSAPEIRKELGIRYQHVHNIIDQIES